jgi:hypothetical protein
MATVSPRQVTSGYFRNHLYVILGLSALAALLSRTVASEAFAWAVATAALSYVGSVIWLYEKRKLGVTVLVIAAATALVGALVTADVPAAAITRNPEASADLAQGLRYAQCVTSGLLLGFTTASMLLGHWYLNAPGMQLAPLRKLLLATSGSMVAHAVICGIGFEQELAVHALSTQDWLFVILRWSFGLAGVAILIWLAWQTLAVPNTQSATGILYVAVIGVFVGETMSLLLSAESLFPI